MLTDEDLEQLQERFQTHDCPDDWQCSKPKFRRMEVIRPMDKLQALQWFLGTFVPDELRSQLNLQAA